MRTVLRQKSKGVYFRRPDTWTTEVEEATDLRSVSRAVEEVQRGGYQDMEVVFVFERPSRMSSVAVDELLASGAYPRRPQLFRKEGDHGESEVAKNGNDGKRGEDG